MRANPEQRRDRGFTLTELLVVVGLLAVLISLLLPALGKARAAANATACLSNLRQMGVAWTMYLSESKGRLPEYITYTPGSPELAWGAYWLGILDRYGVRGNTLLCPAAGEAIPFSQNYGFGNVAYAWSGKYWTNATVVRLTSSIYRDSSYGYNRYLTVDAGFDKHPKTNRINGITQLPEVPVFLDAVYFDFLPINGSADSPVPPPPNLRGDLPTDAPEHWRFLIARHGRGVNACFADGTARRVPLDETYMLKWKSEWNRYRLPLPMY